MLSLGMDIGTSTVKLVLLKNQEIEKQWMAVHHGNPFVCLKKGLSTLELAMDTPFSLCVTGSNTEALLEQDSAIPSLGDIPAIVEGVRWIIPQVGSVIEIGSQGARFITDLQSRAPQFSVNEHCAGGTGSFFEDQMSRVGCRLGDYSSLVEQAQSVPRLSGRCAVFAKTDIIHRQQEGVSTPDILLGLCYAMIRNYKVTIVRRLPSVETLGAVNVVCSDKTGTLTKNEMTVQALDGDPELLLTAFLLCNDAKWGKREVIGDPTEAAFLLYADRESEDQKKTDVRDRKKRGRENERWSERLRREWVRSAAQPFDSERKRMTTVCRKQDRIVSFTKGAPDVILKRCDHYKDETGIHPMTEQRRQKYERQVSAYSASGGRVLGAAMKNGNDMSERGMTFLGLAVLEDPVRPEAAEAVREFRRAGVTTVMITGDHKNTALAVAKKLGIADSPAQCVTGEELDRMGDDGLEKRIGSIRVFARVSSDHKVRIVQAFKKADGIVAMTGDGVNDAPSLKAADVGIAMGKNGTDVAKQAADIVLTDDNFATIRNAIEEGREIYENIKKTVIFLLSSNFGEIMTMFFAILFSLPAPLKASHILWINLITDSLPALALGTDVCDGMELMEKEPRRPGESLFAHGGGICTVFYGFLIALISLTAFLVVPTALLVGSGRPAALAGIRKVLEDPMILA